MLIFEVGVLFSIEIYPLCIFSCEFAENLSKTFFGKAFELEKPRVVFQNFIELDLIFMI